MYPIIRVMNQIAKNRRASDLPPDGEHISYHRCWPQDLDMFMEMNNGRILTIMELGRFGLAKRVGLLRTLKEQGWGLTVAGTSVRYRKRIKPFVKFRMNSKAAFWDERFLYVSQSIWIGEDCATHALFRTGVVKNGKLVPTKDVFTASGADPTSPSTPGWAQNWIDAEKTRPWPPSVG